MKNANMYQRTKYAVMCCGSFRVFLVFIFVDPIVLHHIKVTGNLSHLHRLHLHYFARDIVDE